MWTDPSGRFVDCSQYPDHPQCNADGFDSWEETDPERALDDLQTTLDVVGLAPVIGEAADGVNAVIYTLRGDLGNAGLSCAAMIPFLGWGATGARATRRIFVATSRGNVDIAFDVLDQRLLNELSQQGVKHTSEDILRMAELPDGRIAFLELGDSSSGLAHILERHASDFASRGVDPRDIPDLIMTALISGQQVGSVRSAAIYEVKFKGTVQRLLVTVSDNGYIVSAYPQ
jgi:hypothetical protein